MFRFLKFTKRMVLGVVAALLVAALASPAIAGEVDRKLYERAMRSTVLIHAFKDKGRVSLGTGVLIKENDQDMIATAGHVVNNARGVVVFFPVLDERGKYIHDENFYDTNSQTLAIPAKVMAINTITDVALILPVRLPEGVSPLKLASDSPAVGQRLHLVGHSRSYDGALWRARGAKAGES